jgi:uncharacterized RDD family membrane protein YckC
MFGLGVSELYILVIVFGVPLIIVYLLSRFTARKDREQVESTTFPLASSAYRLANFLLDSVFCWIILFVLFPSLASFFGKNTGATFLFGLGFWFLYYFVFEMMFQRTPAKFITRTKVVLLDGSRPSSLVIAKRTLSRFMPFEPLSGNNRTWWHDRWTKTRVVRG